MAAGRKHWSFGIIMAGTKKSLGQHWLKNREILDYIADLAIGELGASKSLAKKKAKAKETTTCLEIGPGLGTLTSSLLKRFDRVVAVEYDERLAENLPASFPGKNLKVLNEDILDYDFNDVKKPYVIAGNIPYYITQPIVGKVLELPMQRRPERVVFLMQKEVAERIAMKNESTPLGVLVYNQAEVELGRVVKRDEFEPAPKVDSQVVIFKMRKSPLWRDESFILGALLYLAFDHPRKKLLNNLMMVIPREEAMSLLTELEMDLNIRPGELSFEDYQRLWDAMGEKKLRNAILGSLMSMI